MYPGETTGTPLFPRPTFLMCPPRFFDVQYVINPWMEGNLHAPSYALALTQWKHLHTTIESLAEVLLIEPKPALPDMVFTANAGLVHHNLAIVSRFRCRERQGEEPHFRSWFTVEGFTLAELPPSIPFEGEGDALFTPDGARLWIGHGWRTDLASHEVLRALLPCEVAPLRLIDPRFYHLDTCFAPLPGGELLYYPAAFDAPSLASIEAFYPAHKRVAVEEADALRFACNAVVLGTTIVLNAASSQLLETLEAHRYTVHQVPLSEFLKAGGAAKCLALRLS
ncbi:dimethylarginine dimethylaminohydrolase family protein [Acidipila sp. EB88]|uniref:dimethylarginine dimethylaminohydrolase family protein n=1 Tax=Acidipila sp. EB88 TaxID=2305226 RepID=UPI000F5F336B|nr:amidinotransferase [Acidipila sp. EB88]RRA47942.1 amidinotransferase [Acidipila sp. EB88]